MNRGFLGQWYIKGDLKGNNKVTKKGTNKKAETPAKYAADSANEQNRWPWNLSQIYFSPYYPGTDQASKSL